jgi:Domain of unknown function (DUF4338)
MSPKWMADDWQQSYGHPVLVAESFVDSQLFPGTCYKAQGRSLLGEAQGSGRNRQDYYTEHGRPKQLWMREPQRKARALLCAKHLPAELQHVEDAVIPGSEATGPQLRKLDALHSCQQTLRQIHQDNGADYLICVGHHAPLGIGHLPPMEETPKKQAPIDRQRLP